MAGISRENVPPKFLSVMDVMLPPTGGFKSIITSSFNTPRSNHSMGIHGSLDIAYNTKNARNTYTVYSPLSGKVVASNFNNTTKAFMAIVDDKGYSHQFLHGTNPRVKVGDSVSPGTALFTMGDVGYGAKGVHIHYQLKAPKPVNAKGYRNVDPVVFWSGEKQIYVNVPRDDAGKPVSDHPESDNIGTKQFGEATTEFYNQYEEGTSKTVAAYRPRMATPASESDAQYALLPNRIPMHEPWPRVMNTNTDAINGPSDEPEFNTRLNTQHDQNTDAGAKLIGKLDGEDEIIRGPFWRR